MKRLLLVLTIATHTLHPHEFAYYEQKTREILPIMEINSTYLYFVCCHKEPSLKDREKNPTKVFLNIEHLNKLSDNEVLFECALQAQLTRYEYDKYKKPNPILMYISYFGIMFSLFCAPIRRPSGTLLAIGTIVTLPSAFLMMFLEKGYKTISLDDFEHIKLQALYRVTNQLLANESTAPLALYGLSSTLAQEEKIFNKVDTLTRQYLRLIRLNLISNANHWIKAHPNEWQRLKSQLPKEITTLFYK